MDEEVRELLAEHEARRARLIQEWGLPAQVPSAVGLRAIGRRGDVHPADAIAFLYRDRAAAGAWAAENARHHGVPSLGMAAAEGGVIGVLDLRVVLTRYAQAAGRGWHFTDPALPDDWHPGKATGLVG